MAIKRKSKINPNFNMSSMTDIFFLLLLFFMISSTLINPNALKLLLPKSTNQTSDKPVTVVSIDKNYTFYLNEKVIPFSMLERRLVEELRELEDPCISLQEINLFLGTNRESDEYRQRSQLPPYLSTEPE
ncbi:MAG: ExbD/TolR family protein [Butyricimonas faecihominis]